MSHSDLARNLDTWNDRFADAESAITDRAAPADALEGEWPDDPAAFDTTGWQGEPVPVAEPEPYDHDLPPFTDAEATALAERLLAHAAKIEALQTNTEMLVAEHQRIIDAILAEEEYRIRHWIRSGDPKAKSRRTIYGLLGTRKQSGGLVMVNADLALKSVTEMCPGAIRDLQVIDRRKLPAQFTAPGFDLKPVASKLYFQALPKGTRQKEDDDGA